VVRATEGSSSVVEAGEIQAGVLELYSGPVLEGGAERLFEFLNDAAATLAGCDQKKVRVIIKLMED